jgi:hypothetical protein
MNESERSLIIEIVNAEEGVSNSAAPEFFFKDYAHASDASSGDILRSELRQQSGFIKDTNVATDVILIQGSMEAARLGECREHQVVVGMSIHRVHEFKSEIIVILNNPVTDYQYSWDLLSKIASSLKLLDSSLFQ